MMTFMYNTLVFSMSMFAQILSTYIIAAKSPQSSQMKTLVIQSWKTLTKSISIYHDAEYGDYHRETQMGYTLFIELSLPFWLCHCI